MTSRLRIAMAHMSTTVLVVESVAARLAKGESLFEPIGIYSEHRNSRPNRGSLEEYMTRLFSNQRRSSAALCRAVEFDTADSATCDKRTYSTKKMLA